MLKVTTFQRRTHPRYSSILAASASCVEPGNHSVNGPIQLVDLSRYGVGFRLKPDSLAVGEQINLDITLPSQASIPIAATVVRKTPETDGAFMVGGELSFADEGVRRRLHSFLRSLGSDKIIERRKTDRRQRRAPQNMECRRGDRRRNFGIFTDAVSFAARLPRWKASYYYYQRVESLVPGRALVDGVTLISFASKDYLGLTHHPRVKQAAIQALERFGTSTTGSRALNGTHPLHEELEREIANFKGTEAALVFPGGYFSNIAILSGILKKDDVVLVDEDVHVSIIDGCVTAGVKIVLFRHNSADDLAVKVKRHPHPRRLIIVEGVYSVDGDLGCLPDIRQVAAAHQIALMVDDGHGFGLMGKSGSGTAEHYGMRDGIDLDMGIFSAALAGIGGFVACKSYIREYLRHFSRGVLFTTSLTPATTAGILEALRVIRSDPSLRAKLWENVKLFKEGISNLGYQICQTGSAIISIPIGNEQSAYKVAHMLKERGVYVNVFRRPAVRRGEGKLRLSMSASHSEADIAEALEAFKSLRPFVHRNGALAKS